MSDIAIRAEGLSKLYRLGKRERYRTLRDTLTDTITAPFRHFRSQTSSSNKPEAFWALKDVSFEVKRGEVIGIIGRNGAGKSTLLKILARITEPTEGEARIHGRIASLLEVGTGFHPELSGRDNIYLNGAILGMKKAEIRRKFDEIVAFAEVEKFIDTPVKHYSSGMYVRLAFAVAAHMEPEILVVDEVLAVGDIDFQRKCLGKMESVSDHGRTVLFVSHNMAAISKLCKSAFLLRDGALIQSGPTSRVLSAYARVNGGESKDGSAFVCREDAPWGSGRIRRIMIQDENGEPLESVSSGGPVRIKLLVETREPIRDLSAVVTFRGALTSELVKMESQPERTRSAMQSATLTFECTIRELSFVPGRYFISVGIAHYGVRWIQELRDVATLEVVEPKDPCLQMSRHGDAPVAAKHDWKACPLPMQCR